MTRTATAKLPDGTEVECEFEIEDHGSPGNGWDDPGSGTMVSVDVVTDPVEDVLVVVTDEQRWALEEQIAAAIDENPEDFYGDDAPDYY